MTSAPLLTRSLPDLAPAEVAALDALQAQWSRDGLDLPAALRAEWYHALAPPGYELPLFDLRGAELVVLLGNSAALWPAFVAALRAEPRRLDASEPVDDYVTERVGAALAAHVAPLGWRWQLRWAWEPPPRRIAMQRLAEAARLAWLAPCHLAIHPTFGPWFALRAAIVFDRAGPSAPPPAPPPCDACAHACVPAAAAAAARPTDWRAWLALREACPTGRAHRYDPVQTEYHYTKNRALLRALAGT